MLLRLLVIITTVTIVNALLSSSGKTIAGTSITSDSKILPAHIPSISPSIVPPNAQLGYMANANKVEFDIL